MPKVTVYTAPGCMDCAAVRHMLQKENIPYREVDISTIPKSREALALLSGFHTVPQVFLGAQFIGQVADIRYLIQTGQLTDMLRRDDK